MDANFYSIRELLDSGALPWYDQDLNTVIQAVTDIKLNHETTRTWKHFKATANAVGKQGTKRPVSETTNDLPPPPEKYPNVPEYLYKVYDLT